MARGKISDRVAARLGDHPVGRHIRGKKMTEVIVTAIFALGVLALVAVWAAATAGYESTSIFSPNWNLTDNDHWYSKFIPTPNVPLCQPAFINTGSTFRTTNGVFLWEMGKGFNVSALPVNQNNATQVNFNATLLKQYSDDHLDHCDVSGVAVDMDLMQATVTVQIYATCIDPKWPALLHTENVYSIDQGRQLDEALWFNQIVTPDPENNASVPDAMNSLASDLWNRMKAVYLRSSNVLPIIRGLRMVNGRNCALETKDKRSCYDAPLSLTNNTRGFYLYPNLTVDATENDPVDWNVTTNNFINAIFAAARYDFGSNMTTNLFVNKTAREQLIIGSDANQLDNNTALMNHLDGATSFLTTPVFDPPKIARIRTSYMCSVMKMKPLPSFIISVLGLAFAIFGVVFAAAVVIVKKLTGKDFGAAVPVPNALQPLAPMTSIVSHPPNGPDDKDGEQGTSGRRRDPEKGHSISGSSGDFRDGRTDGSGTPAPSYHLNARSTEAMYAPLNDRSTEAGGSGANSPLGSPMNMTTFSSFSSLTGLAGRFTDKLPFGDKLVDKIPGMPSRGNSDLSVPKLSGADRLSGSSNKWMNMAAGGIAGMGVGGAAAAAANHFSDKAHQNLADSAQQHLNMSGPSNPMDFSKNAEDGQVMFGRPAQAAKFQQMYQSNPSEYVPFAVPDMIREGGSAETTPTPARQQAAIQAGQAAFGHPASQASAANDSNTFVPAALAGAGALGLAGAGAAAYAAHSSNQVQQPQSQQPVQGQMAPEQQMYAPTAQNGTITAVSPARVTSPGPPVGHTSSVPARVTSPGPPVGAISSGAPARVTSPGPPVGVRSAGAPTRVTSPGAPVGVRSSGAPARVTSPGPPVGYTSNVPARVTSPGPPVGARSTNAPTSAVQQPEPKIHAPQPRRAPSPTWLAEQEAAATAAGASSVGGASAAAAANPSLPSAASLPSSTGAQAAPALDFTNLVSDSVGHGSSGSASSMPTPDSAGGLQSPLTQIQHTLNSSFTNVHEAAVTGASQAQAAANSATSRAAGAGASAFGNNPFAK